MRRSPGVAGRTILWVVSNAVQPWKVEILFDFLPKGKNTVHIYSDDESANTRTNVGIARREVTDDYVYKIELSK